MAYICRCCAQRAQRSALSATQGVQRRAFTQSSVRERHGSVPTFRDSESDALNESLDTIRDRYFFPAYLNKQQRNLIYKDKYKQQLENSPARVTLGDEDFDLVHVDRRKDLPARRPLVNSILKMMRENKEWHHLVPLFVGLHTARVTPDISMQERIIRQAAEDDNLDAVLTCLTKVDDTGMTLKNDEVLHWVLRSLRRSAAKHNWERKYLAKSLTQSKMLASILEQDGHTRGKTSHNLTADDPRTNSLVIGVFLELYGISAVKYQKGQDTDGSIKRYAERAVTCLRQTKESAIQDLQNSEHAEFFSKFPLWHGLRLANTILGNDMPSSQIANQYVQKHEGRLSELVQGFEAQNGAPESYAQQAVAAWNMAQQQ
ncbi:hypothetical protein MBLNU457_6799t1 [Dothideomycetes sp. NU457]